MALLLPPVTLWCHSNLYCTFCWQYLPYGQNFEGKLKNNHQEYINNAPPERVSLLPIWSSTISAAPESRESELPEINIGTIYCHP